MDNPRFDYVVGHKWDPKKPATGNLGIYTHFQDIHHGDENDARKMLEYVRHRSPDREWSIYRVRYEKLTVID